MKTIVAVAAVLACLGCGGGGSLGSGDLSEDQCRKLLTKISEVMYADLSAEERAEVEESPEELEESVQDCVSEQSWNKAGYDCVMEAKSESDLKSCVLQNG